MSKKPQKKTTSTSKKPLTKANTSRTRTSAKAPPAKRARAPLAAAHGTPASPEGAASRLPPTGTVIQKRDRYGALRCECAIEDAGVRYNGKLYRSLSGAAMAAAADLGLTNTTQNGFTFWGLTKPRRPGDPLVALDHAWQRYRKNLDAVVNDGIADESRQKLATIIAHQVGVLQVVQGQVTQ